MFHIFLKTPLYKNSNFVPHLIEHLVLSDINSSSKYFQNKNRFWENYLYYTNFFLETKSKTELNNFLEKICSPLDKNKISYEKKVLFDELSETKYIKKLINKLIKKYFDIKIKYSKVQKVSNKEVFDYHNKYYKKENFIILETDKVEKKFLDEEFVVKDFFDLKIENTKEKIFLFDFSVQNIFITNFLQELFEEYICYVDRYFSGKYYSNEVFLWEFEEIIFMSISEKDFWKILEIPNDFIKNFIKYKLNNFKKIDFSENDGISMLRFWYTFSDNDKKKILNNLEKYFLEWKKFFIKS